MAKSIFEPTSIGSLKLENRIFRSSVGDGYGVQGHYSIEDSDRYAELARGQPGCILSGYTYVSGYGMIEDTKMMGIYDDSFIEPYKELTDRVHKEGSKMILQIVHIGSATKIQSQVALAPSAIVNPHGTVIPKEMTIEDIERIKNDFVNAAVRAEKSGFDGIEVHAAHLYLLSEFLSPHLNHRTDKYGGNDENRARITVEIIEGIRKAVKSNYPILVKLDSLEAFEDGITLEGFLTACKLFEKAGANGIEVSGTTWIVQKPTDKPLYLEQATKLAEEVSIPVILTGGVRNIDQMNQILATTKIQYFGMARPLIREPDLLQRWKNGDTKPAACISCNGCLRNPTSSCVLQKKK